jgi:hypothetical protein
MGIRAAAPMLCGQLLGRPTVIGPPSHPRCQWSRKVILALAACRQTDPMLCCRCWCWCCRSHLLSFQSAGGGAGTQTAGTTRRPGGFSRSLNHGRAEAARSPLPGSLAPWRPAYLVLGITSPCAGSSFATTSSAALPALEPSAAATAVGAHFMLKFGALAR